MVFYINVLICAACVVALNGLSLSAEVRRALLLVEGAAFVVMVFGIGPALLQVMVHGHDLTLEQAAYSWVGLVLSLVLPLVDFCRKWGV